MSEEIEVFWRNCLTHFEKELTTQQYKTWIKPLTVALSDDDLIISAPNRFVLQWIKDRFFMPIETLVQNHFAGTRRVVFNLADSPIEVANTTATVTQSKVINAPKAALRNGLNPNLTFDNFVTGKANQLARAAAIQVAEHPGTAYNPLFVYGGVGLGKTHLIQAIGNLAYEHNPKASVRYIHAEQYVSDVVRAYQHKAFDEFKKYYHSLDLLLIDDIQFFSGKNRTQEEFFYAFNALTEAHKQVIITCDTFHKDISGIEDRLISRLGWGLTVSVEPPELEMRVAILIRKALAESINLDENIAFFIAKHIQSNVRELEGALKRILAYSRFSGEPLSIDLCKETLKDLFAAQHRQISIENIQKTVADYYKIKVSEMYSKKRSRIVARPRQMAMALTKELTQLSLPDIGDGFGGRDHTTVLHACRKIAELKLQNADILKDFGSLIQILRG
jgi:chromosomal replication initiator protein